MRSTRSNLELDGDHAFSFTDCTSFTVMRERRLIDVLTTDDQFRVMGFRPLPSSARPRGRNSRLQAR